MAVNRAKQRMLERKPAIGGEVGDPRYIIDLEKSPTTVSEETMSVPRALPPLYDGTIRRRNG